MATDRAVVLAARHEERQRKERLLATAQANQRLAEEARARKATAAGGGKVPVASEAFFDQFNRGTR